MERKEFQINVQKYKTAICIFIIVRHPLYDVAFALS